MRRKYRIKSKIRFTLFLTIVLFVIFSAAGTIIGTYNAESLTKTTYSEIRVQTGDTLWDLAREFGPDNKDIRKIVYEICKVNDVSAESIYPGQTLLIPVYI
ncbi:MAG: LysM peptidoglycan-binding domain-containing protein [Eubacteriales bacterium]|nr:LysM peptidoglycan-binding domain-containing protein [Eubacteriales bacterium]